METSGAIHTMAHRKSSDTTTPFGMVEGGKAVNSLTLFGHNLLAKHRNSERCIH